MMKTLVTLLLVIITLGCSGAFAQEDEGQDEDAKKAALAKANQNPVANLISVPFEFWHHEGPHGDGFTAITKPVIPSSVGGMNLINRFIIPYASISGILQLPDTEFGGPVIDEKGLGDITYQGFLSPSNPGSVIWGAGLALQMPTATNDALGSNLWSAGPSFLALTMPGKWVLGLLAMNIWDFAGSGDGSINKMTLQPILSYQLGDGWYLTSTPAITATWEADSGEKWNVPLGGGFGRLQRFGKLPVDLKLVYYDYLVKPTFGPDWSVLFGVKFLIPTGEMRKSMQQ